MLTRLHHSRAGSPGRDVLILLALCGLMFFLGLGSAPLWDEDETRYSVVAREMLRSGDWIVPRYQGTLSDKPAALEWVIAGGFKLLGESAAGARLGSAISATIAVLATWRLASMLCGAAVGFWTGVMLSSSLLVVVEGRAATADASLLAVITLMAVTAVRGWWRGGECSMERWSIGRAGAIGSLAGVAVMLKGLVGVVVPFFAFWLFATWQNQVAVEQQGAGMKRYFARGWHALLQMRPLIVVGATVVVAGPWHLAVAQQTNGAWLSLFYLKHHFERMTSSMEGHHGFPLYQVIALMCGLFPWSVCLPLSTWRAGRLAFGTPGAPGARFLFAWLAVWLAVFTVPATQLPHYILPAYPAAAAIVAMLLVPAFERNESLSNAWLSAAAGGLAFGAVVILAVIIGVAKFSMAPELGRVAWLSGIPFLTAVAFALLIKVRKRRLAVCSLGAGAVALVLAIFLWAAPVVAALNPIPRLVATADAAAVGRADLATYRFSLPGVLWASDRAVLVCPSANELGTFLHSRPAGCALIDAAAYDEISRLFPHEIEIIERGRPLLRRHEVLLVRRHPQTSSP